MRRWSRLTISSVAALLLLLSACSSAQTSSPGPSGTATAQADTSLLTPPGGKHVAAGAPVKIGLINDEGGTAESFPDIRVGAEAAVQYANAYLGGIAGRPVKLDECESKGTPASSAACANQMVADHVTMVLHGIDSDAGTTAQTVMNAGIPVISTAPSSAQEMTSQLSFSLTGGATAFVAALGQYMARQHYKSSVLFALNAPGGSALYQTAIQFLQHAGISTKLVMVPPGTADITPQMDAAVAQHPGFLWMLGDAGLCLSFLKAYRASGSSAGIGLIGQCSDKQVTSVISPAGAIATEYSVPNGTNTEARLYQTVLATYAAGTDPAGLAYVGYTMALGVVRALRGMTGPVTPQTAAARMRAAKDVVLPVANGVTFSCDGKQVPPFPAPCSDTVFIVRLNAQGLPGTVLEKLQAANLFG
jgi:branched-chain amino acid transport system substrate-binding protein